MMNPVDKKWIDALRLFIGGGHGMVPYFHAPDGDVDAVKTMTNFMEMFDIKPVEQK